MASTGFVGQGVSPKHYAGKVNLWKRVDLNELGTNTVQNLAR